MFVDFCAYSASFLENIFQSFSLFVEDIAGAKRVLRQFLSLLEEIFPSLFRHPMVMVVLNCALWQLLLHPLGKKQDIFHFISLSVGLFAPRKFLPLHSVGMQPCYFRLSSIGSVLYTL